MFKVIFHFNPTIYSTLMTLVVNAVDNFELSISNIMKSLPWPAVRESPNHLPDGALLLGDIHGAQHQLVLHEPERE